MAQPSISTLTTIAPTVPTEGHRRVKPSVYFRPMAQPTSKKPATTSTSHAISGLREFGEGLAELRHLGRRHRHAIALVRVLLEEILVVGLGRPVIAQRLHLGHDGPRVDLLL